VFLGPVSFATSGTRRGPGTGDRRAEFPGSAPAAKRALGRDRLFASVFSHLSGLAIFDLATRTAARVILLLPLDTCGMPSMRR
jgi:hypothetical protein